MAALVPGRLARTWEKNAEEIRAILERRTPRFLRNRPVSALGGEIPVFVFHSVRAQRFEQQLRYLTDSGYRTLSADELVDRLQAPSDPGHRNVALTFDDATGSFWAVAYPLLRKYGHRAILFAISGLVPSEEESYPSLERYWEGKATLDEVAGRERVQPMCTWRELRSMHASGLVDIQSHSATHARVPVSSQVVDFVHPDFDPWFFGNVNLPLPTGDSLAAPARTLRLGAPIYRSAPRLAGRPRYVAPVSIDDDLVRHVADHGGPSFFDRPRWRSDLRGLLGELQRSNDLPGATEAPQETNLWIEWEFVESRRRLEEAIPGASIRHFCYPWFAGSEQADAIAGDHGYRSVFYGMRFDPGGDPMRVPRISEEYLFCLPGAGRRLPWRVWVDKLRGGSGTGS